MNHTQTETPISGKGPILFDALNHDLILTVIIVVLASLFLIWSSGKVVRYSFEHANIDTSEDDDAGENKEDTGTAIGKIENILVLMLMLLQAYTALGVIFAAKSIVRKDDMGGGDTSYYLTGTLANFTYSVLIGLVSTVLLWGMIRFDIIGAILAAICTLDI